MRVMRTRVLWLCAVVLLLGYAPLAWGQAFPGMPEEKKAEKKADGKEAKAAGKAGAEEKAAPKTKGVPESDEEKKAALKQKIQEEHATGFRKFYLTYLSEHSPYQSLILAVLTLMVLVVLKKYATRMLKKYAHPRIHKAENLEHFLRTWNAVWKFVIGVFVLIALSGSLKMLGLSAAFVGMMLGWSLQAPVTGLAAWLMIILKHPFRIGDRVIIGGVIGDVTDITLTHVILNQVGGTIGGEERSGRGVLVPTATLFGQIIMNYTLDSKYVLDEVPIRLTFDSDYELAKQIMLDAARSVTAEVVAKTKIEPFTRCEFFEAGVIVRLRYQVVPDKRQEMSSLIVEKLLAGFKQHYPQVKYCYPQSVVHYRWAEDGAESAAPSPGDSADTQR